jgi:hypothetical protein
MNSIQHSRNLRHRVKSDAGVRVIIRRNGDTEPIDALLVDVSQNGLQLRVSVGLTFEEAIAVHIVASDSVFELAAVVKWLRPADKESWYVGCRIQPAFSEEALTQLVSMGCIDRRGAARNNIRLTASVCGELELSQKAAVIHNLSEDGFGLASPEPRVVGQQIIVRVPGLDDQTISFPARVQWQLQLPDGFICGCSSSDRDFHGRLCELVEVRSMASQLRDPPGFDPTPRYSLWIALAVTLLFVFPTLLVILVEADSSAATSAMRNVDVNIAAPAAVAAVDAEESQTAPAAPAAGGAQPTDDGQARADSSGDAAAAVGRGEPPILERTQPAASAPSAAHRLNAIATDDNSPLGYRTWTDDTGRYRVVARLVAVEGESVRLEKENGRTATVPFARLSHADVEYARHWISESQ